MISRPESARPKNRSAKTLSSLSSSSESRSSSSVNISSAQQHQKRWSQGAPTTASIKSNDSTRTSVDESPSVGYQPSANVSAVSMDPSIVSQNEEQDEDFDEDTDILEFQIDQDGDPSIMRSDDTVTTAPVVVQHSAKGPNKSSTSLPEHHYRPETIPEDTNLEDEQAESEHKKDKKSEPEEPMPSEHSHQNADNAFAAWRDNGPRVPIDETEWQDMKTVASYEVYDDKGKLIVHRTQGMKDGDPELNTEDKKHEDSAAKGYTRVTVDEDVKSITSMDEKADFLFDEDELSRDPLKQLQATKDMLTDAQRIAYVGLSKVLTIAMAQELAKLKASKKALKVLTNSMESLNMWAQKMMIRLYAHMDISPDGMIIFEEADKAERTEKKRETN